MLSLPQFFSRVQGSQGTFLDVAEFPEVKFHKGKSGNLIECLRDSESKEFFKKKNTVHLFRASFFLNKISIAFF